METLKDSILEACEQAKRDAVNDISGFLWIFLGVVLSLIAVLLASLSEPLPPMERLRGKPLDYVSEYRTCYQQAARSYKIKKSLIGTALGIIIIILFYLAIILLISKSAHGYWY